MLTKRQLQIVDIINENNSASTHLISSRLNVSRQSVHRQLNAMVESGVILRKGAPPKTVYSMNEITNTSKSTNIVKQDYRVTKQARRDKNEQSSAIIWFTGLSGSGKSTLANAVEHRLFEMGKNTYVLDGDNVRHGLNKDLTFSAKDRTENIRRIGEVANLMVDAGLFAITAFISPYRSDRNMVRSLVEKGEFVEVFVKCPLEVCEQRDVKGLYEKARKGQITNFTGIDAPYEEPEEPELVIETDKKGIEACVDDIIKYMTDKEYIKK